MSRARLYLHLAALLTPLAAAGLWGALMFGIYGGFPSTQFLLFGGIGVLSAQIAALLGWRGLDRRAREGRDAWVVGFGMAAITHVLFGVLGDVWLIAAAGGWHEAIGSGGVTSAVIQVLFFVAMSLFALGAITFPVTALMAHWIAVLRRRELADVDT